MSLYKEITEVRAKIVEELVVEFGGISVPQMDLLTLAEMRLQTVLALSVARAKEDIEKAIEIKKAAVKKR